LHDEFEKDYNAIKSNIDTIAERMRVFGIKPKLTMEFIMEKSTIKEPKKELSAIDMVREILKDFEILHKNMLYVVNISLKNGDVATEHMITRFIEQLEKRNWMYTSWCK
jgi:starvation-inducible DNA-binding protein